MKFLPFNNSRSFTYKQNTMSDWIVSEIPGLHRTYANLGNDGEWVYWEKMADGRWKWNPKWVKYDPTVIQTILTDLEAEWMNLLKEEDAMDWKKKTDEWYKSFDGRKRDVDAAIVYYRGILKLIE